MHSIFLLAAWSSPALAKGFVAVAPHQLFARQDQSFVPSTNIVSSCASNEVQCPGEFKGLPYCVTPSRGDVCCSEGYGCPGGTFCLTNGRCCPDGIDPKTCALAQGVTLPSGFQAGKTVPYSASTPAPSSLQPPASTPTTKSQTPTTKATDLQTPTTAAVPVTHSTSSTVALPTTTTTPPYTVSGNSTTANPTATGIGAGPTGITPFTGAASALSLTGSGILAAFIGIVGFLSW